MFISPHFNNAIIYKSLDTFMNNLSNKIMWKSRLQTRNT